MQKRSLNCVSLAAAAMLSMAAFGGAGAMTLPGPLPTANAPIFDDGLGTPKVEDAYWCGGWGCRPGWGYRRWGYRPWGWG